MRLALISLLSLAPSAAFACAMYIPNEDLTHAMNDVDAAAKADQLKADQAKAAQAAVLQAAVLAAQAAQTAQPATPVLIDAQVDAPPTANAPAPTAVIPEISAS